MDKDREIWLKSFKDPKIADRFNVADSKGTSTQKTTSKKISHNNFQQIYSRLKTVENDIKIIKKILRSMGKFGRQIQNLQNNQGNSNNQPIPKPKTVIN